MNDNQNLTTGKVSRKLTAFALPLLPAVVGLVYFKRKGWENRRIIQKADSPAPGEKA